MNNRKELFIWILAIVILGILNPLQTPLQLCFFEWVGITWCPGEGLARSIHFALRGKISLSLHYHILGIPTLIAIIHRIFQLSTNERNTKRKTTYAT